MPEVIKCAVCDIELKEDMQAEYSKELSEYFCNVDCATHYYYEYLKSVPFLPLEKTKEELEKSNVKIIDGKLCSIAYPKEKLVDL